MRRKRGIMVRRAGFTLIELLLVLVIIGVITAVTVPEFVRSMQGNRLRTAARTVVAAGRYARSMAVLHQRAIAIEFEIDGSRLVIDSNRIVPAINTIEDATANMRDVAHESIGAETPEVPTSSGPGMNIRLERMLDMVTISEVRLQQQANDAAVEDGPTRKAVYASNGRCTPYRVRLEDHEGNAMEILVDALGSAELARRIAH